MDPRQLFYDIKYLLRTWGSEQEIWKIFFKRLMVVTAVMNGLFLASLLFLDILLHRKAALLSMITWNHYISLPSWERSRSWMDFFALSFVVGRVISNIFQMMLLSWWMELVKKSTGRSGVTFLHRRHHWTIHTSSLFLFHIAILTVKELSQWSGKYTLTSEIVWPLTAWVLSYSVRYT